MTPKTNIRIHDLSRSSWLASATLSAGVLTLQKRDGGVLVYRDVPPRVLGALLRSRSAGAAYNRIVRERYPLVASIPAPLPQVRMDLEELLRESVREAQP